MVRTIFLTLVFILLGVGCNHQEKLAMDKAPNLSNDSVAAGEYIFAGTSSLKAERLREVLSGYEFTSIESIGAGLYLVKFSKDPGLESLKARISSESEIRYVQPNFKYKAF